MQFVAFLAIMYFTCNTKNSPMKTIVYQDELQ